MAEYIPAVVVYLCAALFTYTLCERLMSSKVVSLLVALLWLPVLVAEIAGRFVAMLRGGHADG